jgi:hypothetical protein
VNLCEMVRDAPIVDKKAVLDLKAADRILQRMPGRTRGEGEFLIGRFLQNHGQPGPAQKYLERCRQEPEMYIWVKAIAAASARTLVARESL